MDCQREEPRIDFLRCLNTDLSLLITSYLDGAGHLVRFCVVSRFWREYAIANGLAKQACWKLFPQLCNTVRRVDTNKGTNVATEWEIPERDHKAYIGLLRAVARSNAFLKDCIESAISASSTDNPLNESIINTLNPRDRLSNGASYWSSKGQLDPQVPETLTYKIKDGIWSIVEVDVQPFEAFSQRGNPIYAAKSVRFRFGNPKPPRNEVGNGLNGLPEVEWTYTSPEFPMMQANYLQRFKLPLPVSSVLVVVICRSSCWVGFRDMR